MKTKYDARGFGKVLKLKRIIDDQIDLRSAGKKTGVSPATISRIENGYTPELSTYATLCNWVGCKMEDFIIKCKTK